MYQRCERLQRFRIQREESLVAERAVRDVEPGRPAQRLQALAHIACEQGAACAGFAHHDNLRYLDEVIDLEDPIFAHAIDDGFAHPGSAQDHGIDDVEIIHELRIHLRLRAQPRDRKDASGERDGVHAHELVGPQQRAAQRAVLRRLRRAFDEVDFVLGGVDMKFDCGAGARRYYPKSNK